MDNNSNNKNKISTPEIILLIIAAFGLIVFISDVSESLAETRRKRAEQDRWYYENIQKGADEYNRNHPTGITSYKTNKSNKGKSSYSTSGSKSSGSATKSKSSSSATSSYTSTNIKKSNTKKTSTNSKTLDPMDYDIDTYYEDYIDEFEDEDDAWDDFEDNDDYWDDY